MTPNPSLKRSGRPTQRTTRATHRPRDPHAQPAGLRRPLSSNVRPQCAVCSGSYSVRRYRSGGTACAWRHWHSFLQHFSTRWRDFSPKPLGWTSQRMRRRQVRSRSAMFLVLLSLHRFSRRSCWLVYSRCCCRHHCSLLCVLQFLLCCGGASTGCSGRSGSSELHGASSCSRAATFLGAVHRLARGFWRQRCHTRW